MQYQFHVFSLLCLFTIVHWSQFIINIHLLLAGKGLVSPFYRRTNWPKDVIKLFGSCLCFCDGVVSLSCWNILQTNFGSESRISPVIASAMMVLWLQHTLFILWRLPLAASGLGGGQTWTAPYHLHKTFSCNCMTSSSCWQNIFLLSHTGAFCFRSFLQSDTVKFF